MAKLLVDQLAIAQARVIHQKEWIANHGQNLEGYIKRYGEDTDPNKTGDGGRLIYQADMAALYRYQKDLDSIQHKLDSRGKRKDRYDMRIELVCDAEINPSLLQSLRQAIVDGANAAINGLDYIEKPAISKFFFQVRD